jgi:TonB family protein
MLNVLLESDARPPRPSPATTLFSVVIHTALIVVFVAGRAAPRPPTDGGERETVRYLIPLDRVKAPPPLEVRTHWHGLGLVGQGTGVDAALQVSEGLTGPPVSGRRVVETATTAPVVHEVMYDTVATAIDVDSIARVVESAAPAYPQSLLAQNIEGKTVVQFVVDTLGRVDTLSFTVIEATHAPFADAVRDVLPAMRFTPAIMASRKVKQLVQQPFLFRIVPPTRAVAKADSTT